MPSSQIDQCSIELSSSSPLIIHGSAANRSRMACSSPASMASNALSPSPIGPPKSTKPSSTKPSMNAA